MKISVFSDSHGVTENIIRAVSRDAPDLIVHLGDFSRDAELISKKFPDIALRAVCGNCDAASRFPEAEAFRLGSVKLFITHGHRYGVKTGLTPLLNAAKFSGAELVLYGHTHIAVNFETAGMRVLNPGAACDRDFPSYARISIDDNGIAACDILRLPAAE